MTTPTDDELAASAFTARGGASTPARPHRPRAVARVRRLALGGAGLAALAALSLAAATVTPSPGTPASDAAAPLADVDVTDAPTRAAEDVPRAGTPEVAHLGRVTLHLPAPSATFIGFHEAASTVALALNVSSELTTDLTHREVLVSPRPDGDLGVRPVVALPPRGRAAPATSAIDIVMPADDEVLSPVTGTVVEVQGYSLYRRHPDTKIAIVPSLDPSVVVTLIHVEDARVRPGDRVIAGETVVAARPNRLPFGSQIDNLTARSGEQADPHVHLEVKPFRS